GDDCMTYSVGFRSPSRSELIAHWCDHLLDRMQDEDRYEDRHGGADFSMQDNPGEISAAAIAGLHEMISAKMLDREAFARWFGQYNSTPKYPDADWRPDSPPLRQDIRASLAASVPLRRNPASRFSFIRQRPSSLLLFVDGDCFECDRETGAFAEQLCAQDCITADPDLSESTTALTLIERLLAQGSVAFEPEQR
ncbi:MAG: winged helix domain-containing protein, partial [Sphingobium sp.]